MATYAANKIAPYPRSWPYSVPPRPQPQEENESKRRNRALAAPPPPCCPWPCALAAGAAVLTLLAAAITVPLVVALKLPSSSASTDSSTTTSTTTMTTTTATTTVTTTTATTTVTTTTAILCAPSCTSQQICVLGRCLGIGLLSFTMTWSRNGDGDLVVKTPNGYNICFNNKGPSALTDYGQLDIDDRNGTGPENIYWANSGPVPPTGVYYVCFEPYLFTPNITTSNPISVTLDIKGSNSSTSSIVANRTTTVSNNYDCTANSPTLLTSYSYP